MVYVVSLALVTFTICLYSVRNITRQNEIQQLTILQVRAYVEQCFVKVLLQVTIITARSITLKFVSDIAVFVLKGTLNSNQLTYRFEIFMEKL